MIGFRRRRGGLLGASFSPGEVDRLRAVAIELGELLAPLGAASDDDPLPGLVIGGSDQAPEDAALHRLLPDAYRGDDDASVEFRRLTERGLAHRKAASALALAESIPDDGEVALDDDAAWGWLRTLTDARLVLAERLGLHADDDDYDIDEDDPRSILIVIVYEWLGGVQDSLVQALDR